MVPDLDFIKGMQKIYSLHFGHLSYPLQAEVSHRIKVATFLWDVVRHTTTSLIVIKMLIWTVRRIFIVPVCLL